MDLTQKIDVLDMIVSVLKDHEGELDSLIAKLDKIIPDERSYQYPATVRKWGNSKGAYIPKIIWEMGDIDVGDEIIITVRKRTQSMR